MKTKLLAIIAVLCAVGLLVVGVHDFNNQQTSKHAVHSTITKIYTKKDIKHIQKINKTQAIITLKNNKKIATNIDSGNPPTKKTQNEKRPFVTKADYDTTFTNSWGFKKLKNNHNVILYTED